MLSRANCGRLLVAGVVATAGLISLSGDLPAYHADAKSSALKIAESVGQTNEDPIVEVETTKGPIKIKIFKKEVPNTAGNFLELVNRHFYDGLTFHRYEKGFVIQGGDPKGDGTGNFVDPQTRQERHISLEKSPELMKTYPHLRHNAAGVVAMARSSDPDSASCQWYITLAPAAFLDEPPGYAVFGRVVNGMDNVLKLRAGDKMNKVFVAK